MYEPWSLYAPYGNWCTGDVEHIWLTTYIHVFTWKFSSEQICADHFLVREDKFVNLSFVLLTVSRHGWVICDLFVLFFILLRCQSTASVLLWTWLSKVTKYLFLIASPRNCQLPTMTRPVIKMCFFFCPVKLCILCDWSVLIGVLWNGVHHSQTNRKHYDVAKIYIWQIRAF